MTNTVKQDRFGYFIRVSADGRTENLSAPGEAPVLPLAEPRVALAQRMAAYLARRADRS
jgi:hypothetical protein